MFQGNNPSAELYFNTHQLRADRQSWSLGKDVDLLNQLETFSRGLVDRTCCLLSNIDDFEKDIKVAKLEVKTLSNTFETVSDTQFVENRVFDEEEDMAPFKQEKDRNLELASNFNEKLEDALKTCTTILESKFEAVSIPVSESDDEFDVGSAREIIFIPKNKYKSRPLPHLIGGEDFYKDDSLGLLNMKNLPKVALLKNELQEARIKQSEQLNDDAFFNGDDNMSLQSESSSIEIDETDESLAPQNITSTIPFAIEVNQSSISNDSSVQPFQNQENRLKRDNTGEFWDESFANEETESYSSSEKAPSSLNTGIEKTSSPSILGNNMMSSIQEELKHIFTSENSADNLPRLKVFEKSGNGKSGHEFKKPSSKSDLPVRTSNSKQIKIEEDSLPPNINTEILQSFSKPDKENLQNPKSDHPIRTSNSKQAKIEEDSLLPNVQTEILHSIVKDRAKIKGKRRLPSRKSKLMETEVSYPNNESKDTPVLSPSTDEEDIFVLTQSQAVNESPASSLFMKKGLFSPGSSIEGNPSQLFSKNPTNDTDHRIDQSNYLNEPLGVHRSNLATHKNENLFNDWDPFDTKKSEIFPSSDKKPVRKIKLFDDVPGNEDYLNDNDDVDNNSDIFSDKSLLVRSSSLFQTESPQSTSTSNLKKIDYSTPKLFSDLSDDDTDFDGDIFSKGSPFLVSLDNQRKNIINPSKKDNVQSIEQDLHSRRKLYSSSDSDDNLFG